MNRISASGVYSSWELLASEKCSEEHWNAHLKMLIFHWLGCFICVVSTHGIHSHLDGFMQQKSSLHVYIYLKVSFKNLILPNFLILTGKAQVFS